MAWTKGRPRLRKTGGRKKGSKNRANARREAEIAGSGLTPLDFMLMVMRDSRRKLSERMMAAVAAAPYVHPKLATVQVQGDRDNPVAAKLILTADADKVAAYYKRLEALAADVTAAPESEDTGNKRVTPHAMH